jgi:hypothetical protein
LRLMIYESTQQQHRAPKFRTVAGQKLSFCRKKVRAFLSVFILLYVSKVTANEREEENETAWKKGTRCKSQVYKELRFFQPW